MRWIKTAALLIIDLLTGITEDIKMMMQKCYHFFYNGSEKSNCFPKTVAYVTK